MTTAAKKATYADLEAAPPNVIAEILGGVLYTQPRPASRHALAISGLHIDLGSAFQRGRGGPGGWILLVEPELHLGEDVVVPDLAGWRLERMSEVPDTPAFSLAPDWVCEALSPSTAGRDGEGDDRLGRMRHAVASCAISRSHHATAQSTSSTRTWSMSPSKARLPPSNAPTHSGSSLITIPCALAGLVATTSSSISKTNCSATASRTTRT